MIYDSFDYRGCTINVHYDECCESPRDYDCNLSHMVCFHSRYNLGDKHNFDSELDFLRHMVCKFVDYDKIWEYLCGREGDCWIEAQSDCYVLHDGNYRYEYDLDTDKESIIDQVALDCFSESELFDLLNDYCDEIVIDTIGYYDHSDFSLYIGGICDRWDSGVCGYIYQTKADTIKNMAIDNDWRAAARANMEAEMSYYAAYVAGECYWYEVLDENGDCVDSCGGYIGDDDLRVLKIQARGAVDYEIEHATEMATA